MKVNCEFSPVCEPGVLACPRSLSQPGSQSGSVDEDSSKIFRFIFKWSHNLYGASSFRGHIFQPMRHPSPSGKVCGGILAWVGFLFVRGTLNPVRITVVTAGSRNTVRALGNIVPRTGECALVATILNASSGVSDDASLNFVSVTQCQLAIGKNQA